jgi:hypothetical protein
VESNSECASESVVSHARNCDDEGGQADQYDSSDGYETHSEIDLDGWTDIRLQVSFRNCGSRS